MGGDHRILAEPTADSVRNRPRELRELVVEPIRERPVADCCRPCLIASDRDEPYWNGVGELWRIREGSHRW